MNLQRHWVAIAIMIGFTSCDMRDTRLRSFDKDHWIQVALGTPLPPGMTGLMGAGDTWQGFGCFFRFRIEPKVLQKYLTDNEYEEKAAAAFIRDFTIHPRFENYFSPPWSPDLGPDSKVYVRHPSDYKTLVLVNSRTDTVHIWTGGAHSSGPFPTNK